MRPLLARAFAQASRLPPEEQDALAAFMIATLADAGSGTVHEPAPEDFGAAQPEGGGHPREGADEVLSSGVRPS